MILAHLLRHAVLEATRLEFEKATLPHPSLGEFSSYRSLWASVQAIQPVMTSREIFHPCPDFDLLCLPPPKSTA